jgi:hypothetical protein
MGCDDMPKNEVALRQNEKVEKEEGKLTLEEYQKKYSKPVNEKVAKTFLFVFAAAIGIIIFFCLFLIVLRLFDLHQIAGYVGIPVAVLIFIFVYIVPLVKIHQAKPLLQM